MPQFPVLTLDHEVSMRFRLSGTLVLVALTLFPGCSGGSASSDVRFGVACEGSTVNAICLEACSLGCRGNTCDITDIAQNENVVLRFSQAIDPRYVNSSTIQFRTSTGEAPVGDFVVNGQLVSFVPRVLTVGGQSYFGFTSGASYTMTLPGGLDERNAVRSTAGDPLGATITCTLNVTRGIIDHNGVAPVGRLLSPTNRTDAPLDSLIRVGFNELIDQTPFLQATATDRPVNFEVARTQIVAGQRFCTTQYLSVAGSMRLELLPELPLAADGEVVGAILTFTPASPLPGSACVRVTITDQVRDLSQRPANIQTLDFRTLEVPTVERFLIEEFDTDAQLDLDRSSGAWTGGRATFSRIGGDGRHGSFDLGNADHVQRLINAQTIVDLSVGGSGQRTYRLNVNNTPFPPTSTLSGTSITVSDGRYFFTDMVVPGNVRLLFTGNAPPQITVRGRMQIDGTIDISGNSITSYFAPGQPSQVATDPLWLGEPGAAGGIFAGNGGAGGRRCTGLGPSLPAGIENGVDGQSCRILAGRAYSGQVGSTGGRGALMYPAHGLTAQISYPPTSTIQAYCMEAAAGGGGGGWAQAGGVGQCVTNSRVNPQNYMGPPSPGGTALPFDLQPAASESSMVHFLVGGAGGGGGASSPAVLLQTLATSTQGRIWGAGCGGGGGGGAIALRSGRALRIGASGRILARGGSAATSPLTTVVYSRCGPAGGGSGGSILLQSEDAVQLLGELNVSGGQRGILNQQTPASSTGEYGGNLRTEGGAGSPGLVRLERPNASAGDLVNLQPPGAFSLGQVRDVDADAKVGQQSLFYRTDSAFAPEMVRYEIRAFVNGQLVLFSDDPAVGPPARAGFGPLEVFWQAANITASGSVDEPNLDLVPWRSFVGGPSGIAVDGRNGFRFVLLFDRSGGQTVEVESVKVIYRV